jgi:hypothetical protein
MPLMLLFPSASLRDSVTHEDPRRDVSALTQAPKPVKRPTTSRAEWVIASVIVVAALVVVLLFIGPPHVI